MARMEDSLLADTVAAALKAGADAAEAVSAERSALSINVRMGKLEEVVGPACSECFRSIRL